ncbi:MAG: hypothetical protein PHX44_06455 [Sulfurimonas sp.]|uniref:hypothetical protein n=1 Tax=Sulfurimonas sp. TaxID=2022749 RepID=UPI002639CF03|nr:hypothetical protein [Sulfurimonas sp.]MDD2652673.1 hypothetical protein [Sulfurimonas sp.]MDD3450840.1 hypothetical protein [Sulfurimonas sp.]
MEAKAIQTLSYLEPAEIQKHLGGVSYIIMAAPAPEHFKETPIHFTLFLNTHENLPQKIQEAVFEKFLDEHGIRNPKEVISRIMPVGFGKGVHETHMPLLLVKQEDMQNIPHTPMFVMDFLADSQNFSEAKTNSLTGWSYVYDS